MRQHRQNFTPLFQVITYGFLTAAILLLAYGGARLYRGVSAARVQNESLRGTLAYLQSQVAANDAGGAAVESGLEGDMLVLPLEGGEYQTMIYLSDGKLVEELAPAGARPDPERAQTIADASEFSAAFVNDHALRLSVDGRTALVSLHAEGGGAGLSRKNAAGGMYSGWPRACSSSALRRWCC